MTATWTVPTMNRASAQKKLESMKKKADKYGAQLDWEFSEEYAKEFKLEDEDHVPYSVFYEVCDLTITSEVFGNEGYEVIAKVEHFDEGNVVTSVKPIKNYDEMKPEWSSIKPYCEHCNASRHQKITYMVKKEGAYKQVGRNCLKEYTGINPQAIGFGAEILNTIKEYDIENADKAKLGSVLKTEDYLAYAIRITERQGYIKSGENRANKTYLENIGRCVDLKDEVEITEEEAKKAHEMAEGIKAMDIDTAFDARLNNVQALLKCGYCKESHLGFIAYAPTAYKIYLEKVRREAEREAKKASEAETSQYIGAEGDKLQFRVAEAKRLASWESDYGLTHLYKFIDEDGNVLIWYASKLISEDVKEIKGTVKGHNERDGVKQTVITRCKVVA